VSAFDHLESIRPQLLAPGYLARGVHGERLTLAVVEVEPGAELPEHEHANEQFGMLIEGSLILRVGDETQTVEPGGIWRIPPNTPHQGKGGEAGAVVLDVFSPPRDDWCALDRLDAGQPSWPGRAAWTGHMVELTANGDADQVEARLREALDAHGLQLFARIDHAAGARKADIELDADVLLIFGSTRVGTPLMQADPRVGIELPLRMLIWQDADGTHVGYLDPRELADRYALDGHQQTLERQAAVLAALAAAAAG
jgi:uncharacterized protein (DUF302 family)/quercetin dioxygenase-like cupin family protein